MEQSRREAEAEGNPKWATLFEAFRLPMRELADETDRRHREADKERHDYYASDCYIDKCHHPKIAHTMTLVIDVCETSHARGLQWLPDPLPDDITIKAVALPAFCIMAKTASQV